MARVPINRRILTCDCREIEISGDTAINLSDDTVFQFLSEECEGSSPVSSIDDDGGDYGEMEDEDENENRGALDEIFWETQNQLLQVSSCFFVFWMFIFVLYFTEQKFFEELGIENSKCVFRWIFLLMDNDFELQRILRDSCFTKLKGQQNQNHILKLNLIKSSLISFAFLNSYLSYCYFFCFFCSLRFAEQVLWNLESETSRRKHWRKHNNPACAAAAEPPINVTGNAWWRRFAAASRMPGLIVLFASPNGRVRPIYPQVIPLYLIIHIISI